MVKLIHVESVLYQLAMLARELLQCRANQIQQRLTSGILPPLRREHSYNLREIILLICKSREHISLDVRWNGSHLT
jgi:hypothetical protein